MIERHLSLLRISIILMLCLQCCICVQADVDKTQLPTEEEPKVNMFAGHYGYILTFPTEYTLFVFFEDEAKEKEVAFFYPRDSSHPPMDRSVISVEERQYDERDIIRLNVTPIRDIMSKISVDNIENLDQSGYLDIFKEIFVKALEIKGEKFTISDRAYPLPGFRIDITEPEPLVIIFLLGEKVYYQFTSGCHNKIVEDLVYSLKEVDPHDRPGEQVEN